MIVNADDFGYGGPANAGVVRAFREGLVSSTTLMPTMPGFEEAVEFAHEHRLHDHLGAHLVLNEGEPLTDGIKRCRRFCDDDGRFRQWLTDRRVLRLGRAEQRALADEVRAQLDRLRRAGLPLTHADSHEHAHTELAVGTVVAAVAREAGLRGMRIMQNCGPLRLQRRVYVSYFNARLRVAGLARTRYFGGVDEYEWLRRRGARARQLDDFELMTHPVVDERGELVDALAPSEPFTAAMARVDGYQAAVSFVGARYA